MTGHAELNLLLLIHREYKVARAERDAFPAAVIQVEHRARLGGERRIPQKDPAPTHPGANRVLL